MKKKQASRGGGRPSALIDKQITDIIKLRQRKLSYKEIARIVNCTPDQATYYWRISAMYVPHAEKSAKMKARHRRAAEHMRQVQHEKVMAAQQVVAAITLKTEIAMAVAESPRAPKYKRGNLEWE
jgi:transposase-like protein